MDPVIAPDTDNESPCQACGACCSYSANWPRFTTEDVEGLRLALLPAPSARAGYAVSLTADEDAVLIDLREEQAEMNGVR